MKPSVGRRLARRFGRRQSSLRTYLVALILLSTVPVAALLAYEVFQDIHRQQAELDADLDLSARALAQRVEGDLAAHAAALATLAASGRLDREALDDFAAASGRPLAGLAWLGVFTVDPAGRVRPDPAAAGSVGPPPPAPDVGGTATPRGIALSPVLRGSRFEGRPTVAISVPATLGGVAGHRIGAWIDVAQLTRDVRDAVLPTDGVRLVLDQNGEVVAATAAPGSAAATASGLAPALARLPIGGAREAVLGGDDVRASRQGLAQWPWSVAVVVPAAPLAAAQRLAFLMAISTSAACMLLGLSLGLLLSRRLIQPLDELASAGQATDTTPSAILEIERLRERLLTARHRHDAAMTRLEVKAAEFQALFDSSPIGLAFVQDRDGRSVVHNPAMQRLFGFEPGSNGRARVHQDDVELTQEQLPIYRAARTGLAVAAVELQIAAGDGRPPTAVLAQAVPLLDAAGVPRGAIGAAIDISRRKLDERLLAEAEARRRENQQMIDLAQEAGQVGFFDHDFDAARSSWSPGQARLFGVAPRTPAALDVWWPMVDVEHRAHLQNLLRQVLLLQQEKETFDYRIVRAGSEARWMSSRILFQYHPGGRPRRLIGVTVDVSRHKQLEIEREQLVQREQSARREAEAANRAKDDILSMLGHELRNPLAAISSAVEVMQRIDRSSATASNVMEIIGRQTTKLAGILDEVLDAASVLSGNAVLYRAPLDLAGLTRGVVDAIGHEAAAAGHDIVTRLDPAWADADTARIRQVVRHLLANAVRHTPQNGRIEVVTECDGEDAVLRVSDQGAGLSPELLAAIFDPFVQGEQPLDRRRGGLGLGLALVRRLAVLHGGQVTARSSERGSVFELRLPRVAAPATTPGADRSPGAAGDRPRIAARSVVLVEDNADAALALRTSLELDGHTVHAADDGLAGLAAIVGERPDVAIVDLGLPGLTGFDVALRSRAAGFPGLMIATSGYGLPADTQRTLRSGFDAHLVKPLDAVRLRELLATSV